MVVAREVLVDRVAYQLREWIHDTPMSQCRASSDECPDWPLAFELAKKVLGAANVNYLLGEAEAMDAILQLAYFAGPVYFDVRGGHGTYYHVACSQAEFVAEGEWSEVREALAHKGRAVRGG